MKFSDLEVKGQQDQFGRIQVTNFSKFIKSIREASDKGAMDEEIRKANEAVAKIVISTARVLADTKQEVRAAGSLETSSTVRQVQVRGGGKGVPYFGGANFGSYQNLPRLVKAKVKGRKKGRATIVREGESILKVAIKVEAQRYRGKGSERVKLARTASGGLQVIKGWNNFGRKGGARTNYTKGKDEFLYAAVTKDGEQIMKLYGEHMDRITKKAFPD